MNNQTKQKEKKINPILWFLFAIVIPVIVVVLLLYTVLLLAGVDVNGWLKNAGSKIPLVSSVIPDEEEKSYTELEEKYLALQEEFEKTKERLEAEVDSQAARIESLQTNREELEAQVSFYEEKEEDEELLKPSEDEMVKKLSASFKSMKPKQAALIFADLEKGIAVELLNNLSNDVRGKILEEMEPKLAAELTELLLK